jgi:hypothetical protein
MYLRDKQMPSLTYTISAMLRSRTDEQLPDEHDINGAARGIAKLWVQYRLVSGYNNIVMGHPLLLLFL